MNKLSPTAENSFPPAMKIALGVSAVFHIGLVVLATVGLPYIAKDPPVLNQPVAIEIVDISELTTTDKPPSQSRLKPVPDKPKEEEKPPEAKMIKAPPKVEAKEPPKVKPLDKPIEEKKETVKPKPKTPPPPSAKLEKPKPPEPKKKEEDLEEAVQQEDEFLSVLKNLQEAEEGAEEPVKVADAPTPQEQSPLAKFSQKLSASEVDAIASALNYQFAYCWNLMAGARNAEDITVSINLKVNPDRTVQYARIADQWRYNQDSFYRAAADTALRAIKHPNCETLDLPPEKYDLWKDLTFNFNPAGQL